MAVVLEKQFVIDTQDKSVGITLPITRGNNGYFDVSYTTKEQIKTNIKALSNDTNKLKLNFNFIVIICLCYLLFQNL